MANVITPDSTYALEAVADKIATDLREKIRREVTVRIEEDLKAMIEESMEDFRIKVAAHRMLSEMYTNIRVTVEDKRG